MLISYTKHQSVGAARLLHSPFVCAMDLSASCHRSDYNCKDWRLISPLISEQLEDYAAWSVCVITDVLKLTPQCKPCRPL